MKQAFAIKPIVPLMAEPDPKSERVDELLYGMIVDIIREADEWYEISTHYKYKGFVHRLNLSFHDEYINNFNYLNKKIVINNFLDVLNEPKYNSIIIMTLPKGSIVSVVNEEDVNGFIRIVIYKDRECKFGYVKESHLLAYKREYVDEENFRREVVDTALSYLGTQYRWGGKTPLGIDCSGLVSMAYMINGVNIYRDAKIVEGFPIKEIPMDKLKKGDLLYFPGHVALYLGDDLYVHSTGKTGSDGVVINSLNPYAKNYRADLANSLYAIGSIF